jgi:hypothetical protein
MGNFFNIAPYYKIGRTKDYMELSISGGFVKNDSRWKYVYACKEWNGWSDDGVSAHWWEDKYRQHNKFTFAVTDYLGIAPLEGRYGRLTDDLVFHFAFSYNWKMVADREKAMGLEFLKWMERIDNEGLTETILEEILGKLIPLEEPIPREVWDGTNKIISEPTKELNDIIDRLKCE